MAHDMFLQKNYLRCLEHAAPNNIQLFYVGIFNGETLVGIAILQRVQLYLKDMFRNTKVSCFKEFIKEAVSKVLKGNILVVGNLMHTGQHGLFFQKEHIPAERYLKLVFEAVEVLKIEIKKKQGKTIRAIMFKDFFEDDAIHLERGFFTKNKLHKVMVQPNMIMPVKPEWLSIHDYFSALQKKYKLRYKRARTKLGNIEAKELTLEAIREHSQVLHGLYLNVCNRAKFNSFFLPENHFTCLKESLHDNFKVFGYYLDDKLVGFYTLLLNNKHLETYFLGYDSEHQHSHQLYLNMLYDMAKYGIENRFSSIVYARTAMEIKSSVGAQAIKMQVYIKHTNGFMNAMLKQIFNLMNPKQNWEERHPFSS